MDKMGLFLFGILVLSLQINCNENKYSNYTLVRLHPNDEAQLEAVQHFHDPDRKVEVLKPSRGFNDSMDILVPEFQMGFIEQFANKNGVDVEIKQDHYGRSFLPVERASRRASGEFNVFAYNSYSSIREFLKSTVASHPHLATLQHLGMSSNGRSLDLMKISTNPNDNNPIIFIDAGIHAREWVAPALALYMISRLVEDAENNNHHTHGIDWYILPLVNPDGYEFTRSKPSNRLWRKTRSKTRSSNCFGVDGNRNYGFKWGVSGVSNNPCDQETYAGPHPFSEPETQVVRNVMMQYQKRIKLYVSLHAYGQYLVYPWGYTGNYLPKAWKKLDHLARLVSRSVQKAGGSPFKVLSAGRWYAAAGGSDDFAFGAVGIPYAYTMEVTDNHEFQLPERLLKSTLPPFYEGFKTFAREIKREFS